MAANTTPSLPVNRGRISASRPGGGTSSAPPPPSGAPPTVLYTENVRHSEVPTTKQTVGQSVNHADVPTTKRVGLDTVQHRELMATIFLDFNQQVRHSEIPITKQTRPQSVNHSDVSSSFLTYKAAGRFSIVPTFDIVSPIKVFGPGGGGGAGSATNGGSGGAGGGCANASAGRQLRAGVRYRMIVCQGAPAGLDNSNGGASFFMTAVRDLSGNLNDGGIQAQNPQPVLNASGIRFVGTDNGTYGSQGVDCGNDPSLSFTGRSMALEVKFTPLTTANGMQIAGKQGDGTTASGNYSIRTGASSTFTCEWYDSGNTLRTLTTATTFVTGTEYDISMCFDFSTGIMRLFLNGATEAQNLTTSLKDVAVASSSFGVGRSIVGRGGGSNCNGYAKYVRVSNSARYTSSYTPPSTYGNDANTKLNLDFTLGTVDPWSTLVGLGGFTSITTAGAGQNGDTNFTGGLGLAGGLTSGGSSGGSGAGSAGNGSVGLAGGALGGAGGASVPGGTPDGGASGAGGAGATTGAGVAGSPGVNPGGGGGGGGDSTLGTPGVGAAGAAGRITIQL